MIVQEGVNKSNHPIQNPLLLITQNPGTWPYGLDSFSSGWEPVSSALNEHGNKFSDSIKDGEFLITWTTAILSRRTVFLEIN
jgi:hypothetical protein